jgi:hypothetical protein
MRRASDAWLLVVLVLAHDSWATAETRICLNMIAKNEAKGIMSGLEPLTPELSGWTLCDTGAVTHQHNTYAGWMSQQNNNMRCRLN